MKQRELLATALSIGLLVGCADPTAPRYSTKGYAVEPVSSKVVLGYIDNDVGELPAVRIYRTLDGSGLAGREVVFTLENPSGSTTTVNVSTGADGVARLTHWRLGNAAGRYVATAVADGWEPVVFKAVIPGAIVGIYDLRAVDGTPVPTGDVREAHYVLYEGGVYNAFYNSPVADFTVAEGVFGSYWWMGTYRLDFVMEMPSVVASVVSKSSGLLAGKEMTVQRGHPMDFPTELFVLR